jgi:hypothetical protein
MALFGRRSLPHRATLSRFLADVDRPCLEAFRTLFQQHAFADGWTAPRIAQRGSSKAATACWSGSFLKVCFFKGRISC